MALINGGEIINTVQWQNPKFSGDQMFWELKLVLKNASKFHWETEMSNRNPLP